MCLLACLILQRLLKWEDRERRKEKDYEKDLKREKDRREDMVGIVCVHMWGNNISLVLSLHYYRLPRSENASTSEISWEITMMKRTTRNTTGVFYHSGFDLA